MAILKKVRAATLTEIIVASAIILVIFSISSISINNVFAGMVKSNDQQLVNRLNELSYFAFHKKIEIPFYEETDQWDITIDKKNNELGMEAVHKPSDKQFEKILDEDIP